MISKLLLMMFALFLLPNLHAEAAKASVPRILIFGKTIRSAHAQIIPIAGKALVDLFSQNGFKSLLIEDSVLFDEANLSDYQTLILLDVSEGVFSSRQKKSIEEFFKNGGGLMAIHSSISAGKDWPWFLKLIGTTFVDHAEIQAGTIRVSHPENPANAELPLAWSQVDEWYNFSSLPLSSAIVLATADESSIKGGTKGVFHPIVWSCESGLGRFWYTALGHATSLYTDPQSTFSKMILSAAIWTSKKN